MAGDSISATWQDAQNVADMHLETQFRATAGTTAQAPVETAARADGYGYHAGSQLMKAGWEGAPSGGGGKEQEAGGRAAGIPVKSSEELRAYGQRVLRPGQVQAFGAVLLISLGRNKSIGPWGTIQAASSNAKAVLGVDPSELIDKDLFDSKTAPFDQNTLDALQQVFASVDPSAQAPIIATLTRRAGSTDNRAYVIIHTTEEGGVIDIEPMSRSVDNMLQGSLNTHSLAGAAVSHIQSLTNVSVKQLCQAMAKETSMLTGYDRVMLYEFQPDMHGHVVAEVLTEGVADSMLDLHFPATDIPQANRNIFMTMRSRMIANVGAPSVPVIQSPMLNENIILAGSQLRGVSGCHAQYLQNMGVQATLVLSIVTGDSNDVEAAAPSSGDEHGRPPERSPLWGLLVCHHYAGPHRVDYDHRSAVEFLAKVFALQLRRLMDAEAHSMKQRVIAAQSAVCSALKCMAGDKSSVNRSTISASLISALMSKGSGNVMLQVADASGCAMYLEGKWHTVGECPDDSYLDSLVKWMKDSGKIDIGAQFGTICLQDAGYPDAEATRVTMAGILAADIGRFGDVKDTFGTVIWLRGEMIQEETWAGDRNKPQARAKGAEMSPRASFKAMKELVKFQCRRWDSFDVDGIEAIQLLLQDTIRLHIEGQITSRILVTLNQERLRNMDELTKVASELRSVISSADVPIARLDPELRIISCNTAAEPLFGSSNVEETMLVGYLQPKYRGFVEGLLRKAVATKEDPPRFQVTLLQDMGGHGCEALVFCHVKCDIFGELEELVLVFRDVTAQSDLMSRVSAREHDIIQVIQNSTSPIFAVNSMGYVNEWNYAMERLTGESSSDIVGKIAVGEVFGAKGLLQTIPSKTSPDAATEMGALLVLALGENTQEDEQGAKMNDINLSFLKRTDATTDWSTNAKQIDVSLYCRPRFGPNDEIVGAFFFIQDLSVPNALEKAIAVQSAAEAAAEAKTRHIAFLCHEIRNPVNGILATVQAMEEMMSQRDDGMDVGEMFDLVKTTMSCTDQLRRTVDGILDINKLEEEKLDVVCSPFKISTLLRTVVSQVVKASEEKGLYLECEVSPELADVTLNGDEGRIQQVLANFCWNSVKFTNRGGVRILVESESGEKPGSLRLFFKVVDTGKGMDQKTKESLFQRYAMGHHRVGKYGGSGLGLSICRSLAELMNGHVHCISTLGKGSTFVLELELETTVTAPSDSSADKSYSSMASEVGRKAPAGIRSVLGKKTTFKKRSDVEVSISNGLPEQTPAATEPGPPTRPESSAPLQPAVSSSPTVATSSSTAFSADHASQSTFPARAAWEPQQQQHHHHHHQHQQYHQPMPMLYQQFAVPMGATGFGTRAESWNLTVVREEVYETSVAILIEAEQAGVTRQLWGAAEISPGMGFGPALVAAHSDAVSRIQSVMPANPVPEPAHQQQAVFQQQPWYGDPMAGGMHPLGYAYPPMAMHGNAMLAQDLPHYPSVARAVPSEAVLSHAPPATFDPAPLAAPVAETLPAPPTAREPAAMNVSIFSSEGGTQHPPPVPTADPNVVPAADGSSPPQPTAAKSKKSPAAAPVDDGLTYRVKTVLAVDDDDINLKLILRALRRAGIDAEGAEDGRDVIEVCVNQGKRFDLILLDENMRVMNGTEAALELRKYEHSNGLSPIPIIATTGNSAPHDIALYHRCGINGILSKPLVMKTVVTDINSYYNSMKLSGSKLDDMDRESETLPVGICMAPTDELWRKNRETFEESEVFGQLEIFGRKKPHQQKD